MTTATWDVAAYADYHEAVDHAADIEIMDEDGDTFGRVRSVPFIVAE